MTLYLLPYFIYGWSKRRSIARRQTLHFPHHDVNMRSTAGWSVAAGLLYYASASIGMTLVNKAAIKACPHPYFLCRRPRAPATPLARRSAPQRPESAPRCSRAPARPPKGGAGTSRNPSRKRLPALSEHDRHSEVVSQSELFSQKGVKERPCTHAHAHVIQHVHVHVCSSDRPANTNTQPHAAAQLRGGCSGSRPLVSGGSRSRATNRDVGRR